MLGYIAVAYLVSMGGKVFKIKVRALILALLKI